MGDAEAWRRWNALRYVLEALEEIAPEALEDLARLVPVYREAAPHMDRPGWYYGIIDWESLEEALRIITDVPGFEESLAKLRDFREALLAWGRRWNLAHPEPFSWAIQHFPIWAKAPEVAGKAIKRPHLGFATWGAQVGAVEGLFWGPHRGFCRGGVLSSA
jgi:hypothetical protein